MPTNVKTVEPVVLEGEVVEDLVTIGATAMIAGTPDFTPEQVKALFDQIDSLDNAQDGFVDGIPMSTVIGDIVTNGNLTGGQIHRYLVSVHGQKAVDSALENAIVKHINTNGAFEVVEHPASTEDYSPLDGIASTTDLGAILNMLTQELGSTPADMLRGVFNSDDEFIALIEEAGIDPEAASIAVALDEDDGILDGYVGLPGEGGERVEDVAEAIENGSDNITPEGVDRLITDAQIERGLR